MRDLIRAAVLAVVCVSAGSEARLERALDPLAGERALAETLAEHRPRSVDGAIWVGAARVDEMGARVEADRGAMTLRVAAFGRAGRLRVAKSSAPLASGAEVRVHRGHGVVEWWRSLPSGLEHGIVLGERPEGAGAIAIDVTAGPGVVARDAGDAIALIGDRGDRLATYGSLLVLDADGARVPARMAAVDGAIRITVADEGHRYPIVVDPLLVVSEAVLMAGDGTYSDFFGWSVAMDASGSRIAIGAPEDEVASVRIGSVRIFARTGTTWTEEAVLAMPSGAAGDQFGRSVSMSEDGAHLLVGAPGDDVGSVTDGGTFVHFSRASGSWTSGTVIGLPPPGGPSNGDRFGEALVISGDGLHAAVGAPGREGGATMDVGQVHTFRRATGSATWTPEAALVHSDAGVLDHFGSALAMTANGDRVLVGMPDDDNGLGSDVGTVRPFLRSGTSWSEETAIAAPDGDNADQFGYRVAVDRDASRAIISVISDDTPRGMFDGSVRIFARAGTSWSQEALLDLGDASVISSERSGAAVAITADGRVALTGNTMPPSGGSSGGAAPPRLRVYTRSGATWALDTTVVYSTFGETGGYAIAVDATGVRVASSGLGVGFSGTPGHVAVLRLTRERGAPCTADAACGTGFCVDGFCCNTACGGGAAGDCQSCAASDTGGADGTCAALSATLAPTIACGPAPRACETRAVCSAASTTCPANPPRPMGEVCRPAAGDGCGVDEVCNGTDGTCPMDAHEPEGFPCRASTGECDPAEVCSGTLDTCPSQVILAAGTLCGTSATDCTSGGTCNGTSGTCIGGTNRPAGHVCLPADPENECDAPDECDGAGVCLPRSAAATTACGDATGSGGPCDAPDHCHGMTASCVDAFLVAVACRASAGACDDTETCLGDSPDCPSDLFSPADTVCRAATDASCDPAESCDGASAVCPADVTTCMAVDASGVDGGRSDGGSTDAGGTAPTPASCACRVTTSGPAQRGLVPLLALLVAFVLRRGRRAAPRQGWRAW